MDENKEVGIDIPKNKEEFYKLKKELKGLSSGQFPEYSKDMEAKWCELLEIENNRRQFARFKKLNPDIMKEIATDDFASERDERDLKGILVVYVNIGQLPPFRAEDWVCKLKDKFNPVLKRVPLDYGVLWIPGRMEPTRIELIKF